MFISEDQLYGKPSKINERSESFNENRLVTQLAGGSDGLNVKQDTQEPFNYRRESFNENCLREMGDEMNDPLKCSNEGASDEVGSPFVSMPTIPAVYLVGEGDSQPLEKVSSTFYK